MGYSKKDIEQRLEELQKLDYISESNKEDFEEFVTYLQADSNIGEDRIYKYISAFKARIFKQFVPEDLVLKEADKDEVRKIAGKIEASDYSEWTKADTKVAIKKYFNTLYEDEIDRPKRVKKILKSDCLKKSSNIENKRTTKALTSSEVKSMVAEAENSRDRLIPLFMFETGARAGEVLGLNCEGIRLKDVELNQKYADVTVETLKNENKGPKTLQLTRSVGLLQDWMEKHPDSDNPEAYLFANIGSKHRGKGMTQKNFSEVLKRLAEKAG